MDKKRLNRVEEIKVLTQAVLQALVEGSMIILYISTSVRTDLKFPLALIVMVSLI